MKYYASQDRMKSLAREGVFFVPEGDVHAYLGLGHEALGEYEKAAREYREFLASQPHGRYADLVRGRLKEVKDKKTKKPKRAFELDAEAKPLTY
jgi:hypothetical protein